MKALHVPPFEQHSMQDLTLERRPDAVLDVAPPPDARTVDPIVRGR
jgi:hypothetical protein